MSSKAITIPGPQTGASGRYKVFPVEHPSLPILRRNAADLAGISDDYDGSVDGYFKLTAEEKKAHDSFLVHLVEKNRDVLSENRDIHYAAGNLVNGHNLILDQGLNNVMTSYAWCNGFTSCAAGTGTTPTFTDSGAVTATAAGTTVTSSGSFFNSGMTGMLLNFDGGAGSRYITFVDATHATLSSALTVGSPTLFTVYAVNQTGLDTEVKRNSTYLTGAGNCGTSFTSTSQAMQRTYDFSIEVANINYSELGWSNSGSAGNNLFSRSLISGGTVSVLIGQALRVVYALTITVSSASTPGTYSITGWPVAPSVNTDGDYSLGNPFGNTGASPLGTVSTSGGSSVTSGAGYEISGQGGVPIGNWMKLCTGTTLPVFGNDYSVGTSVNFDSASTGSYSSGTFQRDYSFHMNVGTGNRTDFRGIVFQLATTCFVFVFDQDQTKDNLHTLDVNITIRINRVLTNP